MIIEVKGFLQQADRIKKKPEPKHSVTERLKHDSGQEKRQPERKPTQHKKQDMEL